jgi:hypothetical protein
MGTYQPDSSRKFQASGTSISAAIQVVSRQLLSIWAPSFSSEQRKHVLGRYGIIPDVTTPPIVGAGMSHDPSGRARLELLLNIEDQELDLNRFREQTKLTSDVHLTRTGEIVAGGRPAMGGDSIGHQNGATGTLGCLVRNKQGQSFLLSCNHVLAALNLGKRNQDAIWNPGREDKGSPRDRIGILYDFTELDVGLEKPNLYDAALCLLDSPESAAPGIRRLGKLASPISDPSLGLSVRKEGRQTKVTDGVVRLKDVSHQVVFANGERALFQNQLGIISTGESDFAQQGDSGSLVVDEQGHPIGLLFAVASDIDLAFASPINAVLSGLEIELVC